MKNKLLFSAIFTAFFLNCSDSITQITDDGDEIVTLPAISNVEITLNFNAISGKPVTVDNANDKDIGVRISKNDDTSIVIFSDGWIGKTKKEIIGGTNFEYGWEIKVEVVIYKSLGSTVIAYLESIGDRNFFENLDDSYVESQGSQIFVIKQ
jgi:hypothetical protein